MNEKIIKLVYKIYRLENGLLIEPRHDWDDRMFDFYYDSQESALEAVYKKFGSFGSDGFIILPVTDTEWVE